jgi:hypothetical protein
LVRGIPARAGAQAAREPLARWPDDYSGLDGLGMVCEAKPGARRIIIAKR